MKTLDTIRESLQKEIEREVILKTTVKHAQKIHAHRMAIARTKINDLKELQRIESDYILSLD